jgi:hypothetical protein
MRKTLFSLNDELLYPLSSPCTTYAELASQSKTNPFTMTSVALHGSGLQRTASETSTDLLAVLVLRESGLC